jgi:protein CpxP
MARSLVPVLTLAALLAACSHNSPGSTIEPGGPAGAGRADQALLRGITLNADQQQRVDSIRTRYRAQMDQMRQQQGGDRDAARTQMRATMERQQAEIRAVLTPDQQTQFDQNVAEMRNRTQQGGGRPGGAPPA